MKKKLYVEVTFPDHIKFTALDLEQLIYNELHSRLEELGVSKNELDDYKKFDVTANYIEMYDKEIHGVNEFKKCCVCGTRQNLYSVTPENGDGDYVIKTYCETHLPD